MGERERQRGACVCKGWLVMGGEWSVCCWEGEGDGSDSAGRKRVQPPSPPPPPLPEGVWKGATGARVVGRHGRKARATRHSLSPMQPENVVIDLITPPPSPRGGQVNRGSEGSIDATPVSSLITPGSTAAAGASAATEEAGAAPHQEGGLQLGEEGDDEVHEVEVTREARMDTGEAGAAPSFDDDDGCTITGERGFRANRDFCHVLMGRLEMLIQIAAEVLRTQRVDLDAYGTMHGLQTRLLELTKPGWTMVDPNRGIARGNVLKTNEAGASQRYQSVANEILRRLSIPRGEEGHLNATFIVVRDREKEEAVSFFEKAFEGLGNSFAVGIRRKGRAATASSNAKLRFQDGTGGIRVLLIDFDGAVGTNLHRATEYFLADPIFDPALQNQCDSRISRHGTDPNARLLSHTPVFKGTVDQALVAYHAGSDKFDFSGLNNDALDTLDLPSLSSPVSVCINHFQISAISNMVGNSFYLRVFAGYERCDALFLTYASATIRIPFRKTFGGRDAVQISPVLTGFVREFKTMFDEMLKSNDSSSSQDRLRQMAESNGLDWRSSSEQIDSDAKRTRFFDFVSEAFREGLVHPRFWYLLARFRVDVNEEAARLMMSVCHGSASFELRGRFVDPETGRKTVEKLFQAKDVVVYHQRTCRRTGYVHACLPGELAPGSASPIIFRNGMPDIMVKSTFYLAHSFVPYSVVRTLSSSSSSTTPSVRSDWQKIPGDTIVVHYADDSSAFDRRMREAMGAIDVIHRDERVEFPLPVCEWHDALSTLFSRQGAAEHPPKGGPLRLSRIAECGMRHVWCILPEKCPLSSPISFKVDEVGGSRFATFVSTTQNLERCKRGGGIFKDALDGWVRIANRVAYHMAGACVAARDGMQAYAVKELSGIAENVGHLEEGDLVPPDQLEGALAALLHASQRFVAERAPSALKGMREVVELMGEEAQGATRLVRVLLVAILCASVPSSCDAQRVAAAIQDAARDRLPMRLLFRLGPAAPGAEGSFAIARCISDEGRQASTGEGPSSSSCEGGGPAANVDTCGGPRGGTSSAGTGTEGRPVSQNALGKRKARE